jgi:hypothetical protein
MKGSTQGGSLRASLGAERVLARQVSYASGPAATLDRPEAEAAERKGYACQPRLLPACSLLSRSVLRSLAPGLP